MFPLLSSTQRTARCSGWLHVRAREMLISQFAMCMVCLYYIEHSVLAWNNSLFHRAMVFVNYCSRNSTVELAGTWAPAKPLPFYSNGFGGQVCTVMYLGLCVVVQCVSGTRTPPCCLLVYYSRWKSPATGLSAGAWTSLRTCHSVMDLMPYLHV